MSRFTPTLGTAAPLQLAVVVHSAHRDRLKPETVHRSSTATGITGCKPSRNPSLSCASTSIALLQFPPRSCLEILAPGTTRTHQALSPACPFDNTSSASLMWHRFTFSRCIAGISPNSTEARSTCLSVAHHHSWLSANFSPIDRHQPLHRALAVAILHVCRSQPRFTKRVYVRCADRTKPRGAHRGRRKPHQFVRHRRFPPRLA